MSDRILYVDDEPNVLAACKRSLGRKLDITTALSGAEGLELIRLATLFPNETSVERLVSAVLMEIDEDWTTGRRYIKMERTACGVLFESIHRAAAQSPLGGARGLGGGDRAPQRRSL